MSTRRILSASVELAKIVALGLYDEARLAWREWRR
jgi:hypothetical protein